MYIKKSIQVYLDWKQTHTNVAYSRYGVRLSHFANFLGLNKKLSTITGDDIIAFHKHMELNNYKAATIAYSARILKNFFWFWHGRGKSHLNPKEIIPIKFVNADKEIVTKEDFEDMNDALEEDNLHDLQRKLVINLLWDTGMRVSELLELQLSNINDVGTNGLRSAKIRTRKSFNHDLIVWGAKTNELLTLYLGIRLCMEDIKTDHLLINRKTKKPFTPRSIQRWIRETADLVGIDKELTPHSFRHGKANTILSQGGDVTEVASILRHVSPEHSFNYLRLYGDRFVKTAGKYLVTT